MPVTWRQKKKFADSMRREPTRGESLMYNALLAAFLPYRCGIHSQCVVGPYIADFLIVPANIVVEVDGSIHDKPDQRKYDKSRDTFMRNRGLRVMRFTNAEVYQSAAALAQQVLSECDQLPKKDDAVAVTICPPSWANGHKKHRPKSFLRYI